MNSHLLSSTAVDLLCANECLPTPKYYTYSISELVTAGAQDGDLVSACGAVRVERFYIDTLVLNQYRIRYIPSNTCETCLMLVVTECA